MRQELAQALEAVEAGRDDPCMRAQWTQRLEELLPVPDQAAVEVTKNDLFGYLQLCQHLHETTTSTDERLTLLNALRRAQVRARTGLLRSPVEQCLNDVTEHLCEELFDDLSVTTETESVDRIYRTLLEVCGSDEWLLEIAAAHPLIPGRRIAEDLPDVAGWAAPPDLLRKLEQEGDVASIDHILGYLPEAAGERLQALKDPCKHTRGAFERGIAVGKQLPVWLWHTGVVAERFDDVVHRVPWSEIEAYADDEVWRKVRQCVDHGLAGDPERQETFTVLATGFSGTLAELIETSRML